METLDLATELVRGKGGTVLRYAGDAILAEFPSVVAAAEAAVSIQNEIHARNADRSSGSEVLIRIGINLGEVLQDRNEIFGDGVNLAARLEAAAAPGGICISQAVYDQLQGRTNIEFEDGGRESFKNIAAPVHVYRWQIGPATAPHPGYRSGTAQHPVHCRPCLREHEQ